MTEQYGAWVWGFLIHFFATQEDLWNHKQPYIFRDVWHSRGLLIVGPLCHQYPKRRLRLQVEELWAGYLQSWAKAVEFYISLEKQRYLLEKLFWILGELWDVMKDSARNELVALICHQCCRLMGLLLRVTAFLLTASCCQIPFTSKVWRLSWFFSFYWPTSFKKAQRNSKASLGAESLLSQHSRLWSPSDDDRWCSQACQNKILKISSKKSGGLDSSSMGNYIS